MKRIKSFRISEENIKLLEDRAKEVNRTEGYLVNLALEEYFGSLEPLPKITKPQNRYDERFMDKED